MTLQKAITIEHARRAFLAGNPVQAELICQQILQKKKNDLAVLRLMGSISHARGDFDSAIAQFKKCLVTQPKDPALHHLTAQTLMLQGKYDAALASLERTRKFDPRNLLAVSDQADIHERQGQRETAQALLEPYIQAGTEHESMAVVYMRLLDHAGRSDEATSIAARHLSRQGLDPISRAHLLRQLAKICEAAGDYGQAFNAFSDALMGSPVRFDAAAYEQSFDDVIAMFSSRNLPLLKRSRHDSAKPIFIACMPRSGSTLIEQIIHAHPDAFGAGEITHLNDTVTNLQMLIESFQTYPACIADLRQEHVDDLSKNYLDAISRMAPRAQRITNKNLRNYMHLGMVQVLFPGARVIHIRRDRLDNGFACYMAALTPAQFPWVTDLRNIGFAWRQYERLMDHWREVLSIPILEVVYEDLVEDTEAQIRRIIDFCGLPWNDRCLRYWEVDRTVMTLSYDQVRRPIFKTAVKRYKRYEAFLGPLKEALDGEARSG